MSDDVREALEEDLLMSYKGARSAWEDFKVTAHLANRAGLTHQEIADLLDVGKTTAGDWCREGEQARTGRRGGRAG
ncbi:helix-turn-helix domain-containing protein [Streptomyces halobius]|uniref:Helix-turn-helix domain-containing protein n=1 Tax=Streptomyces halobius TaxID=2879846 RepID=A0ABY4M1N5_9ACTN|nr:helix-turn-helix domain-containing protein [Streptomyces halobius]UQA91670.1 helix-turn-helix domain-containing protein [Streptomyces halobius]